VRGWGVWELPAATRLLIAVVTALAAVWALSAVWVAPLHARDLMAFAVLLVAGAVSVEASRRVPEPAGMNANDMLGAWLVPIAVLPPVYSLLAPVALMALTQCRVRHIAPYKRVYSAAAIGVAHATGSALFHALPGRWTDWGLLTPHPIPITLALLALAVLAKVLNAGLVGLAVKTADPEASWADVFVVDHGQLEITEVCAGVLIALVVGLSPLLVLLALAPVLLLQRGMLYAQLHAAARTDAKTGLLNAVAWEREAATELAAARRNSQPAAVLLVDIDHFKRVNDTYGTPGRRRRAARGRRRPAGASTRQPRPGLPLRRGRVRPAPTGTGRRRGAACCGEAASAGRHNDHARGRRLGAGDRVSRDRHRRRGYRACRGRARAAGRRRPRSVPGQSPRP